ncbi:MAG: glycosyltransferase family 1 protein, partial [Actinomycetota bacterium]|nr:glycosyltransferase family 1 protein [Actinomycetota bacterium]
CRANLARVSGDYAWSRVLAPLAEFCRAPRRAPDLARGPASLRRGTGLAADLARLGAELRRGDLAGVARKAYGRARRLLQ